MTVLEFDGVPFDPIGTASAAPPVVRPTHDATTATAAVQAVADQAADAAVAAPGESVGHGVATGVAAAPAQSVGRGVTTGAVAVPAAQRVPGPLTEIRSGVVAAHRAALTAQVALQRAVWQRMLRVQAPVAAEPTIAAVAPGIAACAPEWALKPLARTARTSLDGAALRRLAEGDVTGVFGYRRSGIDSAARLAATGPLVLTEVAAIELRGGTGSGRVVAHFDGDMRAAAVQAAEVFALFTGLQLCLSGSTFVSEPEISESASGTVEFVVTEIDLVPRPHVTGTATVTGVARPQQVTVTVVEPAGTGVGPGAAVSDMLLNEFHMTHLARGDQGIAMGPEFAGYTGVRATRLPTGGLLLVDRVVEFDGARGRLDGASYRTEYDAPADSWYYGDTANESMPHFVYMETSLQAALLMGYYAGPTLTQPGVTLSLRNLGGTATVLRRVDLRDKTIEQTSRLLSTTILPGSSLQNFDYTLSVDGEPFYTGETMFGYFSDEALANQTGLDAGRDAPTWLDEHPAATVRTIDVAARRADPDAQLCARRTLALIDRIDVVDGGGKYSAGYLHSLREIDPSDWYFARHFHLDPVIPGSLGVESVIHAVQEWMLDAGFADTISDPVFRIPSDIAFSWRYRGQFLPTDATVRLEAHIKEIRRGAHGVTVIADGSLWKPGLRIYEVIDLAIELGEREDRP
ncbi:beta-hydroxydecanoyl-ACP dehydratase [Nocardia sp. NBC_00565]|uniref:beta-hydroxydecanoyl-ACP dehydratase n=1 Tax=Nocardia sp. NBC_00565 TaxID=2975993 RepID=UPI002E805993|nr:beta-hydroxydecanoyl-ACP dehydratase [Nocardia sp. NBC_00565]WUC04068.1 beta-hydroxydecanoyl-ACP dehydratase [Nocardia sp. NBC_00565]